jgi:hypothetical protein
MASKYKKVFIVLTLFTISLNLAVDQSTFLIIAKDDLLAG